jgi:protein-S-isoprenylcysteine O-methyltransferase Ste14
VIQAIQDLFSNAALRRFFLRTRYLFAAALVLPCARFLRPEWLGPALAVSLAGQLIQTWCFASLVKNRELTMRGPYLLVRNPMYLGRYFLLLGFVMLAGRWIAVATYTVLYLLYMVSRVAREEKRLLRVFGDRYRAYCQEVNRFVPSPRNLGRREVWFFDLETFLENHAHWNILGTVGAFAALWLVHRLVFNG